MDGDTPLHIAVEKGRISIVRALLDAGADKKIANNNGACPMLIALECSYWAIFLALLDATSSAYAST